MFKWIPWQYLAKRASQAYGFANPLDTLDRVRQFSQPSETNEPIELLRAGFAFHSRGVVNTKAIQNNLDWVWPYWVARQFDPKDLSFVPRAFSFSHINLTHRNWTAVGLPGDWHYGIVDPRGLVTPFHDGWSIDFWMVDDTGRALFPSRLKEAEQRLEPGPLPRVVTESTLGGMRLRTETHATKSGGGRGRVEVEVFAENAEGGYLVVSLRPYNPEGIQFIDEIVTRPDRGEWRVNGEHSVRVLGDVCGYQVSNYAHGDVSHVIGEFSKNPQPVTCPAGMATAAALIRLEAGQSGSVRVLASSEDRITVRDEPTPEGKGTTAVEVWQAATADNATLAIDDQRVVTLYEQACSTLILLSPGDIYPGPYTYRRFWFRDACLIAHALLCMGQHAVCRRALDRFPQRQTSRGYYLSQEGEWDSNGQVLWIYDRFEQLTGESISDACYSGVAKAIDWIRKKRVVAKGTRVDGLLPAGFSAEHFGPNDHYYWDDFWAIGGLEAASRLCTRHGDQRLAEKAASLAAEMRQSVESSFQASPAFQLHGSIPASPNRRMDSGAVGALVADYPLQLFDQGDERVRSSVDWIVDNCFVDDAFFQDMIHSGLNVYLTLDVAQSLLRLGDGRWLDYFDRCADLASPTGQWPEAIHPLTMGGCMGDGQHAWAAAEWIMLARNAMIREENGGLVIGSGLVDDWIPARGEARYGYTATPYGDYQVRFRRADQGRLEVQIDRRNSRGDPSLLIAVPGYEQQQVAGEGRWTLEPETVGSRSSGAVSGKR